VFASFAPATDPRFVVDAVFEQSGYGASVAAPAVAQEYTTLFGLDKPARQGNCTSGSSTSTTSTTVPTYGTTSTTVAGAPCSSTTTSTTVISPSVTTTSAGGVTG
jgi:penicillin-binding protein 2